MSAEIAKSVKTFPVDDMAGAMRDSVCVHQGSEEIDAMNDADRALGDKIVKKCAIVDKEELAMESQAFANAEQGSPDQSAPWIVLVVSDLNRRVHIFSVDIWSVDKRVIQEHGAKGVPMCANVTGLQLTLVTLKMDNVFVKQDILEIIVQKVHILSGHIHLSFDMNTRNTIIYTILYNISSIT